MNSEFSDKEYRDAFVEANIRNSIAFQIRALRKRNGLSQRDLGDKMGKPQNVISRLEDPEYGKLTLQTLLTLARTFDVGLVVRFVSFGQLTASLVNVTDEALAVPSFEEEVAEQSGKEASSLLEEFSTSRFANQLGPTLEVPLGQSARRGAGASNIIDASSKFGGRQSEMYKTASTNVERASGALASASIANQEQGHRARAI